MLELDALNGDFTKKKKLDKLPIINVYLMAFHNVRKKM